MRNVEITVFGLVQGVGFRPFVAEAARELSVSGTVCNAGGVVKIRAVCCDEEALERIVRRLSSCSIPGARVDHIEVRELQEGEVSTSAIGSVLPGRRLPVCTFLPLVRDQRHRAVEYGIYDSSGEDGRGNNTSDCGLLIVESENSEDELRFLPADIATCGNCERELREDGNRRFRYPFISCVSCGPRFSVMEAVPYDRERTSMSAFPLCEKCAQDYTRRGDIRCYAQTIACGDCGPVVRLGEKTGDEAVTEAVRLLKEGGVIAVKDIGGYHFCFDPDCEEAAVRLREYKNRERKPLAVMFPDIDSVREYCSVSDTEERLLTSPVRPIVLLDKNKSKDFAPSVCGRSRQIGAMLPCNPLQILLLDACGPLVMTSGNRGGEPIVTEDERMLSSEREGFPDAVLSHNRRIINGLDDSIYQVLRTDEDEPSEFIQILRRARGLVPEPVRLPFELKEDVLAAGGDLKAVFALGRKNMAYLSGHFGDLEEVSASETRREGISHMEELLGIRPVRAIADKHPGYISVKQTESPVQVQHHHAHVLSVAAEHGLTGPFIGVAFDGTGYGDDGTVWGSEFFLCEGVKYRRRGHFSAITMTGGDIISREAGSALCAYLAEAQGRELLSETELKEVTQTTCGEDRWKVISAAVGARVNTVTASSMGRLFDAAAALLGICDRNTYEGECAQMLQAAAETWADENGIAVNEYMPEVWAPAGQEEIDSVFLLAGLAKQRLYGTDPGELAFAFHAAVADAAVEMCVHIARSEKHEPLTQVALSGGTMCNRLLLKRLIFGLRMNGLTPYLNEKVPCGDGGLALGQIMAYNSDTNTCENACNVI